MSKICGMQHCQTQAMHAGKAAPTRRAPHIRYRERRGTSTAASYLTPQQPAALHSAVPQLRTDCITNCLQTPILARS